MRFLSVVLLVAVLIGLGWSYYFGSYYVDAFKMNDVVGSAALSWTAYTQQRAQNELKDQLKRREIPEYLTPEQCTFYEEPEGAKVVDCQWHVDVEVPLMGERRLRFRVAKAANGNMLEDR